MDGSDALPDENAQERKYRNGAARPGLQHETGNAHSGRWRIDGSDPHLRQAARAIVSALPNHKRPRFYTTWTHLGHGALVGLVSLFTVRSGKAPTVLTSVKAP